MSERWKYQIKVGLIWSFSLNLLMTLATFDWDKKANFEEIFTKKYFFKLLILVLIGIFIIGYSGWKAKLKKAGK
jgi:hypothetical protein